MNSVIKKLFSGYATLAMMLLFSQCSPSRKGGITPTMKAEKNMSHRFPDSGLFDKLFATDASFFDTIIPRKKELNIQVIYTQIDRDDKGIPHFTDHYYNVDTSRYFYPASTVKFPVAMLALQRLNELKKKGIDKNTTMITEADGDEQTIVDNDPGSADGRPTIAQYIRKILLVSDNDAFNRLYEFLGQEYINKRLHKMGYDDIQIIHRLTIFLSEAQNRHTNPVRFVDSSGRLIYAQPGLKSKLPYKLHTIKMGSGYMQGNKLIHEPFDFTYKNRMSLSDLHQLLQSVIFPEATPNQKRFRLTKDDYAFVRKYMSMYPRESKHPSYDTSYPDTYTKKYLYGNDSITPDPSIRIFNKTGTSYGFLTDASYIIDFKNNIEFLLTSVIYCNSDGIFNDDKYDYDTIGYPFFKHLGRIIYNYELTRTRTNVPDLSSFHFDYSGE